MKKTNTGFSGLNTAVKGNNGRVGNIRYYSCGGHTYTRSVTSCCSNPRSASQQMGRAKMGNILGIWGMMKEHIKGYFENANGMVTPYNIFVRRALKSTPIYLCKNEHAKVRIAAPYSVAEGSLPAIHCSRGNNQRIVSSIDLGDGFEIDANTTVRDFIGAVMENNDDFRLNDEIVFIGLQQLSDSRMPEVGVSISRISMCGDVDGCGVDWEAKLHDVVDPTGFSSADNHLATMTSPAAGCYAWIHVRNDRVTGNVIATSTQSLFNANEAVVAEYSSEEAFQRVYESYLR